VAEKPIDDPIPEELRLVRAFVNTLDVEEVTDELASPAALAAWAVRCAELDRTATVTRKDLAAAIEVRDALRRVLLAHSGFPVPPEELEALNARLSRYQAGVAFDGWGEPEVQARGSGVTRVLAKLLVNVATARAHNTWERCKLCPAEDCLWAFYDHSKNRSRRWCSMDVCGNRTKTKTYRSSRR
jgi:predicted RNA-binding Zn ribbon-like protein